MSSTHWSVIEKEKQCIDQAWTQSCLAHSSGKLVERGVGKKNQSHIHHPQWVSKKKKKKEKGGTPLSGYHAPKGQAALFLFGSGICEPTEHVQSEGQSNPEVRCSSSNLWVWGQMRRINDNIKVGGRSRPNQSIGLTHREGKKERLAALNNISCSWY